jgi:hypothetical protein
MKRKAFLWFLTGVLIGTVGVVIKSDAIAYPLVIVGGSIMGWNVGRIITGE